MTAAGLHLTGVQRMFGHEIGLSETSLDVRPGEFVSIVGPSGCGKSTLLNIAAGLEKPDRGGVEFAGREITGRPGHAGYMFQRDALLPWRTVVGNIVLGSALSGRRTRADRRRAMSTLERYGLTEFADHYPHALSGGIRQRVALLRTLALGRDLLLLDEPFGAVDAQTRVNLQQWLLSVWSEESKTIIFVTHDVDEAIFLADRLVVMSPRPGAIVDILDVDLPRPRELDILTDERFVAIKRRILAELRGYREDPGEARQ